METEGALMFSKFISWVKGVLSKMFRPGEIKGVIKADIAISKPMQDAIDLWWGMFKDDPPWLTNHVKCLGLPAAISSEISRLVMVELKSGISGSARATYLQSQYEDVLNRLRQNVEYAAAMGGMAFKPYVDNGRIAVDFVQAGRFLPIGFNSRGDVTSAAFVERVRKGNSFYTRVEHHQLSDSGYTIRNHAYVSLTENSLGRATELTEVDEWSNLEPELTMRYKDGTAPERPLFAYFRIPFANQIDDSSPLGVSIYSRAVELIKEADRQYSRILWEYEGSELAIDADETCLRDGKDGVLKMPERDKRLFRRGVSFAGGAQGEDFYKVFSPAIRDSSLFNGLNQLLRRIEFACCLSYGTLSDPQTVSKTAEEVKTSKQRSYAAVCEIQKCLQSALEHLVWAMDFYASLYKLAPSGLYETSFTWGDGVLEDTDKEFVRRKALADSQYLKPEKFLAWYFGISEAEAEEYLPKASKTDDDWMGFGGDG